MEPIKKKYVLGRFVMEDSKKKSPVSEGMDKDIVYSKAIKAGKRIYYIDVKRSRNEEMYLAITESKKTYSGEGENVLVNFEKHKIFLYREDFEKFANGLSEAIGYIVERQGASPSRVGHVAETSSLEKEEAVVDDAPIKIDIDF